MTNLLGGKAIFPVALDDVCGECGHSNNCFGSAQVFAGRLYD